MSREKILNLNNCLKEQSNIYEKILELAISQEELCREADFSHDHNMDKLNQILAERQELVEQIEEKKNIIQNLKESLKEELDLAEVNVSALTEKFPYSETTQLSIILDKIENLLKNIAELDDKSREMFNSKLSQVKEQLTNINKGKQAGQAYRPVIVQREGYFIDKK